MESIKSSHQIDVPSLARISLVNPSEFNRFMLLSEVRAFLDNFFPFDPSSKFTFALLLPLFGILRSYIMRLIQVEAL